MSCLRVKPPWTYRLAVRFNLGSLVLNTSNPSDTSIESLRDSLAISANKSIWEELDSPFKKFHKNGILFEKVFTEWVKKMTFPSASQMALLIELYGMRLGANPTSWVESMAKVGWYKYGSAHFDPAVGFVKKDGRNSKYDLRVKKGLASKRGAELLTRFLLLCSDCAIRVAVTIKGYAKNLKMVQVLKKSKHIDMVRSGIQIKKNPATDPLHKKIFWSLEELGSHDLRTELKAKEEELELLGRRWEIFGKTLPTVHRVALEKENCSLLIPVWEYKSRARHRMAVLDLKPQGLGPVRRRVLLKKQ